MPRRKCRDRDVSVLVDVAWHDLVRVDLAAGRIVPMEAVTAHVDVDLPGLEDVLRHRLDSFRTINGERIVSSHDPGCEDEIGIADGVVRVHVCEKRRLDVHASVTQRLDAVLIRGTCAPDY